MTILDNARRAGAALAATDADSAGLGFLSEAAWSQLEQIGVLRCLQPKRWGGGEVPLAEFLATLVEIGRHSPAAGWVASVIGVHPWQIALFDEQAQDEIWGADPARPVASSYTPTGTFEPVDGGLRVSGRWSFSSGSHHSDAVILGGIVGTREFDGRQYPNFISAIVFRDDYKIDETWNTAGLQGTGSNDIVVDGVFVPARRTQSHLDYTHGLGTALPGQQLNDGPLYRLPWAVVFGAIIAAGAVGAARASSTCGSRRPRPAGPSTAPSCATSLLCRTSWPGRHGPSTRPSSSSRGPPPSSPSWPRRSSSPRRNSVPSTAGMSPTRRRRLWTRSSR